MALSLHQLIPGQAEYYVIELAVNEAVSNALRYGNGGPDQADVAIVIKKLGSKLIIRVKDGGNGFRVCEWVDFVSSTTLSEVMNKLMFKERGRGIWIMLAAMDQVIYNACGNEVMLVKDVTAESPDKAFSVCGYKTAQVMG